jgi:hypothetical protein
MTEYKATEAAIAQFSEMYDDEASIVGIGIECDGDLAGYRVYVEHTPNQSKIDLEKRLGNKEIKSVRGVKWNSANPIPYDVASYYQQLYNDDEANAKLIERARFPFFPEMCKYENTKHVGTSFFSSNDMVSERNAFYIELGGSTYDISQDILVDCPVNEVKAILQKFKGKRITMLAGGTYTYSNFVTLYYRYANT